MIKIEVFPLIGPDLAGAEAFVNEIGWEKVLTFSVTYGVNGALGAVIVYQGGDDEQRGGSQD